MTTQSLNDMPEPLKREWEYIRDFVNSTAVVKSLLYDLDLMPEQITKEKDFLRMLLVANHFKLAMGVK